MTPLFMKDALLSIAATDYAAQVSSVAFTPSSSVATWKGLKPDSGHTAGGNATWTCDITLAQDYDDALSFANYLFENEGETVTITFEPKAGGATVTADVIISAGAIGGAVDAFAEATVSLGVNGKPAIAPATP